MKVYMIRENYTGLYCSEVAGRIWLDMKSESYVYDKKHATRVMQDTRQMYRNKSDTANLQLVSMSIDDIPMNELVYGNLPAEFFTARKIGFLQGLRHIRYEQVRRYNGLIDYDSNESKSREIINTFSTI